VATRCWFTGASLAIWRWKAFTNFVFFGGRCAGTTVSAIGGFGMDRPSVSGSVAGVVAITVGSVRSVNWGLSRLDGLPGMTEGTAEGLYAARPELAYRVGCRSAYNPNPKPLATADTRTEGTRGPQRHPPRAIVYSHPSSFPPRTHELSSAIRLRPSHISRCGQDASRCGQDAAGAVARSLRWLARSISRRWQRVACEEPGRASGC